MTNLEKYNNVFKESFSIEESELPQLKYQDISEWDSIGHMNLMAQIEDAFEIELDTDNIVDFSSYEIGKEILRKYNVEI